VNHDLLADVLDRRQAGAGQQAGSNANDDRADTQERFACGLATHLSMDCR